MQDQTMEFNDVQVSCVMFRKTERLSKIEMKDIKQSKYPIIYGNPVMHLLEN